MTLKEKMTQFAQSRKAKITAATALMASLSFNANAALDSAAEAAFASLTSGIGDYSTPAYTLMAAVLVFFIGLKWFKKTANKAS